MTLRGLDGDGVYRHLADTPETTSEELEGCIDAMHVATNFNRLREGKLERFFQRDAPDFLLTGAAEDQAWFYNRLKLILRNPSKHIPEGLVALAWFATPFPASLVFYSPFAVKEAARAADHYTGEGYPTSYGSAQTSCKMG